MIAENTIEQYGGVKLRWKKGEVIFRESEEAFFFFQISRGSVKLVTRSRNGDEFVQGLFTHGESFGEPPLLCGFHYPSTAIAMEDSEIWKITKDRFMEMLKGNFQAHQALDCMLCNRLRVKSWMLSSISFDKPEKRVLEMVEFLKGKFAGQEAKGDVTIPVTRQQIADMTGLRVETVIRTVRHLEKEGKLKLINHKIVA